MFIHYLFILGICVEAMTGAISAGRKEMDLFGVWLIAFITALGGGTVRDVLFDMYPLSWVSHPNYILYTSLSALATIYIARYLVKLSRAFLFLDALGLATFVVIGTQKSLSFGAPYAIAILSGTITGICGGILRDILCNDIPLVLRKELYAVIALAGGALYTLLWHFHMPIKTNMIVCLTLIFAVRVLAILFEIELPRFDSSDLLHEKKND